MLLKEMFSWQRTLLPFIILSVALYFPQEDSALKLFFNDLHKGVCSTVANFLRNATTSPTVQTAHHDAEIARRQRRSLLKAITYDRDEASVKGSTTKAKNVIKSIRFSSYEENNLCDLKEGIPEAEFDATVEEVAELTNMPIKLKRVVQRARHFTHGNVLAVNKLQFQTKNGNMVFGRIAVLRKGDTLDMTYSLHSVRYKLKNKQSKPENTRTFTTFSETLSKANDVDDAGKEDGADDLNEISFLQQDLLAFFHKQAIEGFLKHCDYVIKTLDYGQKVKPEILKRMVVNDDKELEVKDNGVK